MAGGPPDITEITLDVETLSALVSFYTTGNDGPFIVTATSVGATVTVRAVTSPVTVPVENEHTYIFQVAPEGSGESSAPYEYHVEFWPHLTIFGVTLVGSTLVASVAFNQTGTGPYTVTAWVAGHTTRTGLGTGAMTPINVGPLDHAVTYNIVVAETSVPQTPGPAYSYKPLGTWWLPVTTVTITPTLMCYIEFTEFGGGTYTVTASSVGHTTRTATGLTSGILVGPLDFGITYSVVVTSSAEYQGPPYSLAVSGEFSRSAILRQRLYDIINAASITEGSRDLYIIADGYGRPRTLQQNDLTALPAPWLEIQLPRLTSTQFGSGVRRTEYYDVPFRIVDASIDEDEGLERATLLLDKVRNAVDASGAINLLGMIDESWSWSVAAEPIAENQMVGLEFRLSVPIQVIIARLPYAAA